MNETIQFYADAHIPGPVCLGLRRRGIDILTTREANQVKAQDGEQLAFATAQNRVLITFEKNFLALHRSGIAHAGIAWCQAQKYDIGELIQALLLLHGVLDRQSMRNHVEYL